MMRESTILQKIISKIAEINGDDAAVLTFDQTKKILATTDAQVSGVHFLPDTAPHDIGWKAISVNVSDIAAMGGVPKYCLVSLVLPKDIKPEFIDILYEGMAAACTVYKTKIIGGNISAGAALVIDVTCLGEGDPAALLYRSVAKPGDTILVTGTLGAAAAGLAVLQQPDIAIDAAVKKELIRKQVTPVARLQEALVIAASQKATSMIDVSDGLSSDVLHICDASKVGARIWEEKVPVSSIVRKAAEAYGMNMMELALNGGEDYELCFTVSKNDSEEIVRLLKEKTGTTAAIIGEILPEVKGRKFVLANGKTVPLKPQGWEH